MKITVSTRGLLFDMDGVLISSIGSVIRCWRRWAKLYAIPNAETYEVPHGMRALEIIHSLRPDVDAAEALRIIEDMEIEDTADLKVLPGVKSLLESLPPERWAIVTSSTRRLLMARLQAAGLPIPKRIVSADDVDRGKPDPLPYLCGAEILGLPPADCIVIEDAPSGVKAGVAAGCRVIGVLGTHQAEELKGAEWFVRSLENSSAMSGKNGLELQFENV